VRRSLVVTDESARHPFLQSLPPHVRRGGVAIRAPRNRQIIGWKMNLRDVRDFILSYFACFVAVSVYIA
jgi:hypothetical protein